MAASRPSVVPLLWYERPREAIAWLETALGFEARMIVDGGEGMEVIHSELVFGDGAVYVVGPRPPGQPAGGQYVHLNLPEGLDAHCARARAAGAKIHREPADQPYGDRVYTCEDPQGGHWSFGQPVKVMSTAEMAAATGHQIEIPGAPA
jgi:uncharacterized glyoxalase superfamily protein PhnB